MHPVILDTTLDRRVFIKGVGLVSLSLLGGTLFGGCETLLEEIRTRPIRRRLRVGSAEVDADIETYRQAVAAMKALPASDARSWAAQAAIHGSIPPGGFNLCQHGTPHFFSWHRAYLLHFERICQKLTSNDNFGLPYWNWNQDPAINPAFLQPSSPLLHPRVRTSLAGVEAVSTDTLDGIFEDRNFFSFGTQLEGTPHNTVHIWVGADMVTGGSARDPVFWTHHAMVDYCWAKWNLELENDNPNDAAWINTSWAHFVDPDGAPTTTTAGVTTLMPLLSYQYESSVIGSSPAKLLAQAKKDFAKLRQRIEKGADVRLDVTRRIPIADGARLAVQRPFTSTRSLAVTDFRALIESDTSKENVFASIDYARLPTTSDFFVRVFVDLPFASRETPTSDPHYAGSFAFFGRDGETHGGHTHAPHFLVNLTPTLRRLRGQQKLSDTSQFSLQLVAVPIDSASVLPSGELELRALEVLVTPLLLRTKSETMR